MVLTEVHTKIGVFCVVKQCSSENSRRFGRTYRLYFHRLASHLPLLLPNLAYISTLKMRALYSSETSGVLQSKLLYNTEDLIIHTHVYFLFFQNPGT
jgi:hypothetical protein